MKKTFLMIAAAVAFVMAFTNCNKEDEHELVDPLEGNHMVEATIHAEVSGAFTKALAIELNYTDFEGNAETVLVNGNYDGANTVFDKTIWTKVDDKEKEATVRIKTMLGDIDTYKAEVAPWALKCNVVVKRDGNVVQNYGDTETETMAGIPIYDPNLIRANWADWAHKIVNDMFGGDGSKQFVITVNPQEIICELK